MIQAKIAYMAAVKAGKERMPTSEEIRAKSGTRAQIDLMRGATPNPEPAPRQKRPGKATTTPKPDGQVSDSLPAIPDQYMPTVGGVRLPVNYDEAATELARVEQIDVCREWAARFDALASYAGQSRYPKIEAEAQRIRLLALRRAGTLIKRLPEAPRGRPAKMVTAPSPIISREQASRDAGFSPRQRRDAERIANIPRSEFDAAISREKPATVEELSRIGAQPDARITRQSLPPIFKLLRRFKADSAKLDVAEIFRGLSEDGREQLAREFAILEAWVGRAALTIRGAD